MLVFAVCGQTTKIVAAVKMAALRAFLLFSFFSGCLAAKFAMFPLSGRSHFMFVAKLGQELAKRGHEVWKFSSVGLFKRNSASLQKR